MTDIEHPKIAGSGISKNNATDEDGKEKSESVLKPSDTSGSVKKHKRAHSRNKSISGRQDFIDEIANGNEYKTEVTEEKVDCTHNLLPKNDVEMDKTKISIDETDALPESLRYNAFDFLCTFISVLTYVVDVVMDCIVAYYFYHLAVDHGIYHYWYFGLTVFFIVLPSLTMTGFSFRWYLMDSDNTQLPEVGMVRWVLRLLVLLLQIAPILRYVDSMRSGIMSRIARTKELEATTEEEKSKWHRERIKWYTLMVYEDADATLLRLYESFMESAPQLVLQIYILLKDPHASRIYPYKPPVEGLEHVDHSEDITEPGVNPVLKLSILVLSVASSLVSLAWSLVVYHRSLRYTFPHKKNISLLGTLFQFLWHFSSITARVLALSLFASALPQWIGPLCAAHWIVMASWVIAQRTAACNTRCEEFLFALVLGAIYIFMFFNAKEERTRYKYLLYYSFCLVENTAIICIWFLAPSTSLANWYVFPAMVGHYLAFFAGIMFMVCYYLWFHPTGVEFNFPYLRGKKKLPKEPVVFSEPIELKAVLLKDNKIASSVSTPMLDSETDGEFVSERDGHLARFLSEHSDKVAVRRFSSLPTGPVSMQHGSPDPWDWGARKLKYMGHKAQDA